MKIGFVSLPVPGHLNPMIALARKVQSRGNEVIFFGIADAGPAVRAAHLNFVPFAEAEYPLGSRKMWSGVAKLHGLDVVRYSLTETMPGMLAAALEQLPEKLTKAGIEGLVIDTVYFFLGLVPMRLGMPFVQVWSALQMDFSGATPPSLFGYPNENSAQALARNAELLKVMGEMLAPVAAIAVPYAEKAGLHIDWNDPGATNSKLAVITQTPREFDFPNFGKSPEFQYAGPFQDQEGREKIPFPWQKLTGKPLVYASLGTLVNGLDHVHRTILEATGRLKELQVVLSVGNNIDLGDLGPIPSNAIVVSAAPQMELLRRASLCITHAGLNTTLESLAQGVPMVAIPIGYDQPGVAVRIAYHGAGEFVELEHLTVDRLVERVQQVRGNPGHRESARYFREVIAKTQGLDVAAAMIERSFGANHTVDSSAKAGEFSYS